MIVRRSLFPVRIRRAASVMLMVASAAGAGAQEPPPRVLTKAIDVRSLTSEEALSALPVQVRGTVIFIDSRADVFVQDETAGTFFRTDRPEGVRPGDIIEVTGFSHQGLYLPGIGVSPYRVVGRGPLPEPVSVRYSDLISGRYHYQRVAIEGLVRSEAKLPTGQTVLRLATDSRMVEVKIEPSERPDFGTLIGSRIRATGMAAGSINARRQLVQPYVQLFGWADVAVLAAGLPESEVPAISGAELLTFRVTGGGDQRVRIRGTVTASFPQGLVFVRDGAAAFAVRFSAATGVAVGDQVQVIGFPEMERFSASVLDGRLLARSPGPRPEPVELGIETLLQGLNDNDLVAVTARVTDRFKTEDGIVLTLQKEGRAMQARGPAPLDELQVGSLVRAIGISVVESSVGARYTTRPDTVSLRIRAPDDIVLLEAPSPWTVRRMAGILGLLVAFVLLAGLWITVLRRQVARQTSALRTSIASEAALNERQRIAREFHDTLEQELAGLSLRLDAAATRDIDEKGRGLLVASRNLVGRIQAETRNLVLDLRSPAESAGDLGAALRELVDAHAGQPGVEVRLKVEGVPPHLPASTVHHLRMMAAEGVTNALKHAAAALIEVHVAVRDGEVVMTVSDDGRGFDVDGQTRGKSGHFGCVGVRERGRKIGASVRWASRPGCGSTLEVTLPVEARRGERASAVVEPASREI